MNSVGEQGFDKVQNAKSVLNVFFFGFFSIKKNGEIKFKRTLDHFHLRIKRLQLYVSDFYYIFHAVTSNLTNCDGFFLLEFTMQLYLEIWL